MARVVHPYYTCSLLTLRINFTKKVPKRSRNSQINISKINLVWQIVSELKEFRSIHKDPMMNSLARAIKSTKGSISKLPCEQMVMVVPRLAHCPGFV